MVDLGIFLWNTMTGSWQNLVEICNSFFATVYWFIYLFFTNLIFSFSLFELQMKLEAYADHRLQQYHKCAFTFITLYNVQV